ncbi:hypothetical protein [Prevotella sp. kh1p2]|uniref:hypothetical protein n=1 Tax=Prevotella sp. kh1p2 TaxID=1761883 RepID=UPI0008BC07DB|nr:hypothetical protein [Prevotella sp. kh1p2]SET13399.1 hypothetical protein SAMN04487825_11561 [Prevotella sp. kh1p2]SNU11952.1 hypothetical protein SAMN06298210_11562 [Prevotellaceae bacterium KH2P17]
MRYFGKRRPRGFRHTFIYTDMPNKRPEGIVQGARRHPSSPLKDSSARGGKIFSFRRRRRPIYNKVWFRDGGIIVCLITLLLVIWYCLVN